MRFWFDTEFIEDGKTIDLISIGVVAEDGRRYYAEFAECDHSRASEWVKANVLPHLGGNVTDRATIAAELVEFFGESPEIWGYFADYDWVALCQLYGTMMDLPSGWPMFCRDVKQLADSQGNPDLPVQDSTEHNALDDADWTYKAWVHLMCRPLPQGQTIYHSSHRFREMTSDRRPQDPGLDGGGWTFRTCEHGGEHPDTMPQAIVATDAEGRSCTYVPIRVDGRVVDSIGFNLHTDRTGK